MRRAVLTCVAALVLGACAGMPTGGPVQSVVDTDDRPGSTLRYSPAPPVPGASPQQVVSGFLDAMLAYPVSRGVAAQYLTPAAAETWRPSSRTQVYTAPSVGAPRSLGGGRAELTLRMRTESVLDAQGRYSEDDRDSVREIELARVDGEWRIAAPPAGLLVTEKFVADYVRPFSVYYFDRSGDRLVPDLVHLVVGDTLPTSLVTSLAGGPAPTSGAVSTSVPDAQRLRPSVPISDDGVADVEFMDAVEELDAAAQNRVAAQLAWTLRQVPSLSGFRLVGGTAALSADGTSVQSVDSWGRYGPPRDDRGPWAVEDGALVELRGSATRDVAGAWGEDTDGATRVVATSRRVAAVLSDGSAVRVTDQRGDAAQDVPAEDVSDLSWAPGPALVVVDAPAGGTRVRAIAGGEATTLPSTGLADRSLTALRLSPDGGRYAATTEDGALLVGAVAVDEDGRPARLGRPRRLAPTVEGARSPAWATSGTRLSFLGDSDAGAQVFAVNVDGSGLEGADRGGAALLPDVGARQLVTDRGDTPALWVVDARDRLWHLPPGGSWSLVDAGEVTSVAASG